MMTQAALSFSLTVISNACTNALLVSAAVPSTHKLEDLERGTSVIRKCLESVSPSKLRKGIVIKLGAHRDELAMEQQATSDQDSRSTSEDPFWIGLDPFEDFQLGLGNLKLPFVAIPEWGFADAIDSSDAPSPQRDNIAFYISPTNTAGSSLLQGSDAYCRQDQGGYHTSVRKTNSKPELAAADSEFGKLSGKLDFSVLQSVQLRPPEFRANSANIGNKMNCSRARRAHFVESAGKQNCADFHRFYAPHSRRFFEWRQWYWDFPALYKLQVARQFGINKFRRYRRQNILFFPFDLTNHTFGDICRTGSRACLECSSSNKGITKIERERVIPLLELLNEIRDTLRRISFGSSSRGIDHGDSEQNSTQIQMNQQRDSSEAPYLSRLEIDTQGLDIHLLLSLKQFFDSHPLHWPIGVVEVECQLSTADIQGILSNDRKDSKREVDLSGPYLYVPSYSREIDVNGDSFGVNLHNASNIIPNPKNAIVNNCLVAIKFLESYGYVALSPRRRSSMHMNTCSCNEWNVKMRRPDWPAED